MRTLRLFLLSFAFSLLLACSHQPSQVTAQIPLVNPSSEQKTAGEDIQRVALPKAPVQGLNMRTSTDEYKVGEAYTSALGITCFTLEKTGGQAVERNLAPVACKLDEQWFLFPSTQTSHLAYQLN